MKTIRAELVLAGLLAIQTPLAAKPKKISPWDLQIDADVVITTKLPEYIGLGRVCSRTDVDTPMVARFVTNYASLYAKSRDAVQKQVDDATRISAMAHGPECLTSDDDARFKALYPDLKAIEEALTAAAAKTEAAAKTAAPTH